MTDRMTIRFIDRQSGRYRTERVYASRFLYWSHNTRIGCWLLEIMLRKKWVSSLYGWWNRRWWSRYKIRGLIRRLGADPVDTLPYIRRSRNFNDFFTRKINLATRPLHGDPQACVAPADGKVLVYPEITPSMAFRIKRATFHLPTFLRDEALAGRFAGGTMIVCRLCMTDYHHFHFPDSGVPRPPVDIPGRYYASGPYARDRLIPYYSENHRVMTLFDSDQFGRMAIVDVGAMAVGSVHECFQPGAYVMKGSYRGFFELGGSTVVLLFEKGRIALESDLIDHSQMETETYLRFGESVGRAIVGEQHDGQGRK